MPIHHADPIPLQSAGFSYEDCARQRPFRLVLSVTVVASLAAAIAAAASCLFSPVRHPEIFAVSLISAHDHARGHSLPEDRS